MRWAAPGWRGSCRGNTSTSTATSLWPAAVFGSRVPCLFDNQKDRKIAHASTPKEVVKTSRTAYRSAVRVALATAFILLLPLVAMQITDEVDWSLADFVFAGALLGGTGLLLELAARKPGKIAYRAAAAAIGIAAIVLGEADDAPGLVLFGGLLIVGTVALTIRTTQRA
jgi:hypothetical protein